MVTINLKNRIKERLGRGKKEEDCSSPSRTQFRKNVFSNKENIFELSEDHLSEHSSFETCHFENENIASISSNASPPYKQDSDEEGCMSSDIDNSCTLEFQLLGDFNHTEDFKYEQHNEFIDINSNNKIINTLQQILLQMYSSTIQCTICLSCICSNGSDYLPKYEFLKTKNRISFKILNPIIKNLNTEIGYEHIVKIATLPCGHKFCETCLTQLIHYKAEAVHGSVENMPEKMRIRCPLCRRKIKVTSISYIRI